MNFVVQPSVRNIINPNFKTIPVKLPRFIFLKYRFFVKYYTLKQEYKTLQKTDFFKRKGLFQKE